VIHTVFQWCVGVLYAAGEWLGIGYEAINVWVFVIVWPIVTLALLAVMVMQWRALRRVRQQAAKATEEPT